MIFFQRIFIDKSKIKRFHEKSGAAADLSELYAEESSFDIYQDRWEFAEHMNFYIAASARNACTISVGNASSLSSLKRKRPNTDNVEDEIGENVCVSIILMCFYNSNALRLFYCVSI